MTTPRHPAGALAAAAVAALIAISTACGDSKAAATTVPPAAWQKTVCGALKTFSDGVNKPSLTLQGLSLQFQYGLPKQSETRDSEIDATAELLAQTKTLRMSVEGAGIPRFAHGAEFQREFVAALRELESSLDGLHQRALQLSSGDGPATRDALLSRDVDAAANHMGTRMQAAKTRYPAATQYACSS
jgi:hypothetical protein